MWQICARLDGIPLALELAAARVRVLTVEQIAARLDDRFRLLTGGSRAALRRQQTLQAAIDWSYELLTEPECALLRRLAVFAGGWSLEAAEAVGVGNDLPASDVLDRLSALVDKSLVLAEGEGTHERFRLPETIRQYATEKLVASGEAQAARTRHRDWYLDLAEQALPELERHEQKRWADRLEEEHDNLRAALAWSAADPADAPALLRLAAVLGRFWRHCDHLREGIRWLDLAVARSEAAVSVDRARALNWLGHFEWVEGNVERAWPLLQESVDLARAVGDGKLLALALRHLSYAAISLRDRAAARELLEEAVTVSREVGSKREIAYSLHSLAGAIVGEELSEAERLLVEGLPIARESGDAIPLCETLFGLGWVYHRRGELARARNVLEECLTLALSAEIGMLVLNTQISLGDLAISERDVAVAMDWYRQALRKVVGVQRGTVAYALERYAVVCIAREDHRRAVRLFGAAATAPRSDDPFLGAGLLEADEYLATTRLALGEDEFASAWGEGRSMSLESAVELALAEAEIRADDPD